MNQAIYSERLILRKFEESDINDIYKIFSDKDTNRFLPWFPLEKLSDARLFYKERCAEVYRTDSGYAYAVCLKEDNVPIGYVNVSLDESHDLGYGLLPQFRGMGIMGEAVGAVLNRLKADGLQYVTATHDVNNPRSGEVMKRAGMTYRYSYREFWKPKNFWVTFRMYQINFGGEDTFLYSGYSSKHGNFFIEDI